MKPLELLTTPLSGCHLIEASAGTGKTHTLSRLFLRLLLEAQLPLERILVVTYTEAATAELRERIHGLLSLGLRLCDGAEAAGADPQLAQLLERCPLPQRKALLERGLRSFDDAAIFTIHGFCRRMLLENAFETGSLFDSELVVDQQNLLEEIARDHWRLHWSSLSPLFTGFLLDRKCTLPQLLSTLGRRAGQPDVSVAPCARSGTDTEAAEQALARSFAQLQAAWAACGEQAAAFVTESPGLNRAIYRQATCRTAVAGLRLLVTAMPDSPVLEARLPRWELFTAAKVRSSLRRGASPPACMAFFEAFGSFADAATDLCGRYEERMNSLKCAFFEHVRVNLRRVKQERNLTSFDDLLTGLADVVGSPSGERLARAVARSFSAALMDEFQDTDRIQYAIFGRLFAGPGSTLFMIGDPKQAIYGFRGADIFTYLDAAEQVPQQQRHTLLRNHRSTRRLVQAVNALFGASANPFVFERIGFAPSSAALDEEPLLADGAAPPPLRFWFLPSAAEGKALSADEAHQRVADTTAAEVSRLLSLAQAGRVTLAGRPLRPADIAVLVRYNAQGKLARASLSACGVPVVLHGMGSVFESAEADEMLRVLAAIAEPADESLVRGALATASLGADAQAIARLSSDEQLLAGRVRLFQECQQLCAATGFSAMYRRLASACGVAGNLLRLPDGERRLTNLLHLGELLQARCAAGASSARDLLAWLGRQRATPQSGEQEHELRLESDENAVTITTIHRSKGLQYPVVFCPFVFGGSEPRPGELVYHDAEGGLVYDFGAEPSPEHVAACRRELLAENVRLLYVALTRARFLCYTAWGRVRNAETSAPSWLLHGANGSDPQAHSRLAERLKGMTDAEIAAPLHAAAAASGGALAVEELTAAVRPQRYTPATAGGSRLSCRTFGRRISENWRLSSFSSLAHSRADAGDEPDRDGWSRRPRPAAADAGAPADSIYSFPRGAEAGSLLHRVLETADFAHATSEANGSRISDALASAHYEPRWRPVVQELVTRLAACALRPGLRLGDMGGCRLLHELEFYFPLTGASVASLQQALARHPQGLSLPAAGAAIGSLEVRPLEGFMHGYIDCVLEHNGRHYLIDWKSNHLGDKPEDYGPQQLSAAMADELYVLQYLIYTVALHRFLASRIRDYSYERDVGGVLYVFLRGIPADGSAGTGVFFDRPGAALVDELSRTLDQARG